MSEYFIAECKETRKVFIGCAGNDIRTKVETLDEKNGTDLKVIRKYKVKPGLFPKIERVIKNVTGSHHFLENGFWNNKWWVKKVAQCVFNKIRTEDSYDKTKVHTDIIRKFGRNSKIGRDSTFKLYTFLGLPLPKMKSKKKKSHSQNTSNRRKSNNKGKKKAIDLTKF